MKRLVDIAKTFQVSRPIFSIKVHTDSIDASVTMPLEKYHPIPKNSDILEEIVCSNYREFFDKEEGCFKVNVEDVVNSSMSQIKKSITRFVEKNIDMKNPRQSKLCRWLYRSSDKVDNSVFIMVYKYLRSFSDGTMRSHNIEQNKNAIALLEAIMEKHE